jgi:cyclophilin family peptidyl-prolyl cis-trans isomerase
MPTRHSRAPWTARLLPLLAAAWLALAGCSASATPAGPPGGFTTPSPPGAPAGATAAAAPAKIKPPTATPLAQAPAAPASDGTKVTIETPKGTIVIELYTKSAPVAAQNFVNLARAGYYDGVVFHRILPGFMIQGGDGQYGRIGSMDATRIGAGGPGYEFPDEPFAGDYTRGTVAMANAGPNTNGSQFFILVADYPLPRNYTIFGRVVSGMDAVDAIVAGPRTGPQGDQAVEPVPMTKVTIQAP